MARYAVVGINCDGYCHPKNYVTGTRHWLAVAWDGGTLAIGEPEEKLKDHAECGRLATASIVRVLLNIPDNATAEQIAAQAQTVPGFSVTVSRAPVASLIPNANAQIAYNCWPADMEPVDLVACHNSDMGTVLITPPSPTPSEDDDMKPILATTKRGAGDGPDPHGPGAIYLVSNFPYGPKRWITSGASEAPYVALCGPVQVVDPFVLDRMEEGPHI